jgi:serine-type D-Ala-D-Ala carboxypeptidase (penicillin-binding protein 5/6)
MEQGPPPLGHSPLQGGRTRRRLGVRLLAAIALIVPLAALAAAAWLGLEDRGSRGSVPLAAAPLPRHERSEPQAPEPPGHPAAVSLEGVDAYSMRFKKPPRAGVVFDMRTGEVLWRRNPVRPMAIASLTKIMTAIVVAERTTSRTTVKITRAALHYSGSGVGVLPKGRRVRVSTMLHGLLLVSGNDAAIALADRVAGSERRFVRLMNARARSLGLRCTRFVSSHGLENGNRSCAADLAAIARIAMKERQVARIVRKSQSVLHFPIKGGKLYLYSHNPLLRARYPGTLGLKTGYTNAAGRCFVGVVRRGRRTLGVVLLRSPDPGRQARKLLNVAFART